MLTIDIEAMPEEPSRVLKHRLGGADNAEIVIRIRRGAIYIQGPQQAVCGMIQLAHRQEHRTHRN
jgi:hypothetical protein